MTELPELSQAAHDYLINLMETPNRVLMLSINNTWMIYHADDPQLEEITDVAPINELVTSGLLEPCAKPRDLERDYEQGGAYASTCQPTQLCMRYLEKHQVLAKSTVESGSLYRGLYTQEQYNALLETAHEFNTPTLDLTEAFARMSPLLHSGEIFQNHRNGQWHILYEETDNLPDDIQINQRTVDAWLKAGLIEPFDGYAYEDDEELRNCHTITEAGMALALHINFRVLDPVSARLTLYSYMKYLEQRLGRTNLVHPGVDPLEACKNYLIIMGIYMLQHPELVTDDPGFFWFTSELAGPVAHAEGPNALYEISLTAAELFEQPPASIQA